MSVELYRQMYTDNVLQMYGGPKRSVLINLPTQESKKGELVGIGGVAPKDAALSNDTNTLTSRKDIDASTASTEDFINTFTPQTGTEKVQSYVKPKTIEASDVLARNEDVLRAIDITSSTMDALMSDIFAQEDRIVINALDAASVLRDDGNGGTTNVSLLSSYEYETANAGYISVDDLDDINAMFASQFVNDEKFLVINPKQRSEMLKADRDYFQNVDFVARAGALVDGNIQKASDLTVVVSSYVAEGSFYAFAKRALCVNTFDPLFSSIEEIALQRFNKQLYIAKVVNAVRTDDKGVVQGTIK